MVMVRIENNFTKIIKCDNFVINPDKSYLVFFSFDEGWDDLIKRAEFCLRKEKIILNLDTFNKDTKLYSCEVPSKFFATKNLGAYIYLGLYGYKEQMEKIVYAISTPMINLGQIGNNL